MSEPPGSGSGPDASDRDWKTYYEKTRGRPPRETVLFALDRFDSEPAPEGRRRFAVELGCGTGRDTIEILRRGWRVLAIDSEAEAIAGLTARPDLPEDARERLETRVARMEDADWPEADLLVSSFALPLCPAGRFPDLWQRIHDRTVPGGRFAGQLYGDRDGWAGRSDMIFVSRKGLDVLLGPWQVEMLREEEEDSITPLGKPRHWHIFHLVLRKP